MKHCILYILFCLITFSAYAQNNELYISVAIPNNCNLDDNARSIILGKLQHLANTNNVTSNDCSSVALIPEISIIKQEVITGGMRAITSIEYSVTLYIQNILTNTVFGTTQLNVSGEGYSENEAKLSAINKIDLHTLNPTFIKDAKSKAVKYYQDNTNVFINKAKSLASQQKFEEALTLLSTYPEYLSEYKFISATISSIFKQYQSLCCDQILMLAQAAYSQQDYVTAADLVSSIDAQSSCSQEAKSLLVSIKRNLDKAYDDNLALQREANLSNERIQKAQIKAIRDIAVSYYKSQTRYVFFW